MIIPAPSQMAWGKVRFERVIKDCWGLPAVVEITPWFDNLILNQGLDGIATQSWADSFLYCAIGLGTTPTVDDAGATVAAQSSSTVTLSGGSFTFTDTSTDAGKMIRWSTGQESRIVLVNSPTSVQVADAKTVFPAQTFKVYRTNQVGLTTETARSNTYFTDAAGCGTFLNPGAGQVLLWRAFDFPVNGTPSPIIYKEVGFSSSGSSGNNLFSRVVPLSIPLVGPGQFLRVTYLLSVAMRPAVPISRSLAIPGWSNTAGTEALETWGIMGVDTDGSSQPIQTYAGSVAMNGNEPSTTSWMVLGENLAPLNSFGAAPVNRYVTGDILKQLTLDPYDPLSFQRTKSAVILNAEGNKSNIRTLAVGNKNTNTDMAGIYLFRFGQNQTKDTAHQLSDAFVFTWGRVRSL